jgi:hypothetical protein
MFSRIKMINAISASLLIIIFASCSTKKPVESLIEDGDVTKISIESDKTETVSGGTVKLTASVEGTGNYSKSVTWKILSGGGKIKGADETVTYTADLAIDKSGPVQIEATARGDTTKKAIVSINVLATTSVSVYIDSWDNASRAKYVDSPNIPVKLYDAKQNLIQEGLTDGQGLITFIGLVPQEYTITEDVPVGYGVRGLTINGRRVASRRLPLTTGPQYLETGFTNTLAVISGQVFIDKDFSRVREPKTEQGGILRDLKTDELIFAEDGVSDTELTLTGTDVNGKAVSLKTKPDSNGRFEFAALLAGEYNITQAQKADLGDWDDYMNLGFERSIIDSSGFGTTEYPDQPKTANNASVTFQHNGTDRTDKTVSFVLAEGASVGGFMFAESDLAVTGLVYLDRDRDGYRLYPGEEKLVEDPVAIPGVTIRLSGNGQSASTISDKDGKFIFDRAVPPGKYNINEDQPLGYGTGHTHVIGTFFNINKKEVEISSVAGNSAETTVPQFPPSGVDPATLPAVDPNAPPVPASDKITKPIEFSDTLSNIMGTVFQDDNKNGIRDGIDGITVDPGLVLNVPMRLTGTDVTGKQINKTASLDTLGEFYFADLLQGTYTIEQVEQPLNYLDGLTRPGLIGATRVGTSGINRIDGISLPAGADAGGARYWIINLTARKILPGYNSFTNDSYSFAELANK